MNQAIEPTPVSRRKAVLVLSIIFAALAMGFTSASLAKSIGKGRQRSSTLVTYGICFFILSLLLEIYPIIMICCSYGCWKQLRPGHIVAMGTHIGLSIAWMIILTEYYSYFGIFPCMALACSVVAYFMLLALFSENQQPSNAQQYTPLPAPNSTHSSPLPPPRYSPPPYAQPPAMYPGMYQGQGHAMPQPTSSSGYPSINAP